jgi:hypothetical protein
MCIPRHFFLVHMVVSSSLNLHTGFHFSACTVLCLKSSNLVVLVGYYISWSFPRSASRYSSFLFFVEEDTSTDNYKSREDIGTKLASDGGA